MNRFKQYLESQQMSDQILNILNKENGDACQSGLAIASKFSDTQEDYDKIWMMVQNEFDIDNCGEGYSIKPEFRKKFANHIAKMIANKQYENVNIEEW